MWLEEQAVHVGQLHFIIVKQQQLQQEENKHTQQNEAHLPVSVEFKKGRVASNIFNFYIQSIILSVSLFS